MASIYAAAATISKDKTPDELALLASVFTQLGDTIATMAAIKSLAGSGHNETDGA